MGRERVERERDGAAKSCFVPERSPGPRIKRFRRQDRKRGERRLRCLSACVGVSPVLVGSRVQHLMYSAFTTKDEDAGGKSVRPSHLVLWRDKKKRKKKIV